MVIFSISRPVKASGVSAICIRFIRLTSRNWLLRMMVGLIVTWYLLYAWVPNTAKITYRTIPFDNPDNTPMGQQSCFDKVALYNGEKIGIDWRRNVTLFNDLRQLDTHYGGFQEHFDLTPMLLQHGPERPIYGRTTPVSHVWARNSIRSIQSGYQDYVVVLSDLFTGIESYIDTLQSAIPDRNVVFIVLKGLASGESFQFPSLNLYGVEFENTMRSTDDQVALIEMADLYISMHGHRCLESAAMETPSILLIDKQFGPYGCKVAGISSEGSSVGDILSNASHAILSKPRVDLTVCSYLDATTGIGSSAEEMVLSMDKAKLRVQFTGIEKSQEDRKFSNPRIFDLMTKHPSDIYLGYYVPSEDHFWPLPRSAKKAKMLFLYANFVTTKPPSGWYEIINMYDHLFVSCHEMAKSFRRVNVTIPISVVPLGVNLDKWPLLKRPVPILNGRNSFRFLLYADGTFDHHRKNIVATIMAYLDAFGPNNMDFQLTIKTTKKPASSVMRILRKIVGEKGSSIIFIEERQSKEELLQLLSKSHCLVFPSKGEGFGLPPREAMATGIPVILAGFAGLEPLADESMNYLLPFTYKNATGFGYWDEKFNHDSSDFGQWASIDVVDIRNIMLKVVENIPLALENGLRGREYIEHHETFHHTVSKIMDIINPKRFVRCSPGAL